MPSIYHTFDQTTLDHQYNAQATVGDITPLIEMYAAGSSGARATLPYQDSLVYSTGPEENLDLFPAGEGAPLLVFVHGGTSGRASSAPWHCPVPRVVAKASAPLRSLLSNMQHSQPCCRA